MSVGAPPSAVASAPRPTNQADSKPTTFVSEVRKRRRMSSEERLQRSRERNRVHAKKTRQRKKMMMEALSSRIEDLKNEFSKLRQIVDERYTAYILLVMAGANEKGDGASMPGGSKTDAAATGSKLASASLAEILGPNHSHAEEDEDLDEAPQKRTRRRGKYTPAEREHIRRERNRMHAKRTRDRKKLFLEESQQTIARMEGENARLREFLKNNNMLEEEAGVPVPQPPTLDVDALDAGLEALDEGEAEAEGEGEGEGEAEAETNAQYGDEDDGNSGGNVSEESGSGSSTHGKTDSEAGSASASSDGKMSRSRSPSDSSISSNGTATATAGPTATPGMAWAPPLTTASVSSAASSSAPACTSATASPPADSSGNSMDADGAEETADEMTDAASDSAGQVVWRHRYRQVNMVVDGTSIRVLPKEPIEVADPGACPMEIEASH